MSQIKQCHAKLGVENGKSCFDGETLSLVPSPVNSGVGLILSLAGAKNQSGLLKQGQYRNSCLWAEYQ